jgi:hypothetical protein
VVTGESFKDFSLADYKLLPSQVSPANKKFPKGIGSRSIGNFYLWEETFQKKMLEMQSAS